MSFVKQEDLLNFLREHCSCSASQSAIDALQSLNVLPVYDHEGQSSVWSQDLHELSTLLASLSKPSSIGFGRGSLFDDGPPHLLRLSSLTTLRLPSKSSAADCTLPVALRNLSEFIASGEGVASDDVITVDYLGGTTIETRSERTRQFVNRQTQRAASSSMVRAGQFANSAYYMGSKRSLSTFLVEAVSGVASHDCRILDLMCGSGAASGAFCREWPTVASDAQSFCRLLAEVQGGGFSVKRAELLLDGILPRVREHSKQMRAWLDEYLGWEDHVFHGDLGPVGLNEYRNLMDSYPTYPNGNASTSWDPVFEVERRKVSPEMTPYCLFAAYFANTFFGIRQCVEIDSIRFAISTLDNERDRRWSLGALVAAVSYLGTTYGGHFAQPLIKGSSDLTTCNITRIVEKRAASVLHEFSIRLNSLARESEHCQSEIVTIEGPWENALDECADRFPDEQFVVYLDAPYKREEYSRYYHVLESLVLYNYPDAIGVGKAPDKSKGERFRSEFFQRSQTKIENAFVSLIQSVLTRNGICVWSYSDNGDANISKVCQLVQEATGCEITTRSVSYEHKPQGGRAAKAVTEYVVILKRA